MKKVLLTFALIAVAIGALAQEATTTWAYVYNDFQPGKIHFKSGRNLDAPVNIHLGKSTLHYTEKDIIKEAKSSDVLLVEIGEERYFSRDSQMMKVLASNKNSFLGEVVLADYSKLNSSSGAYGASSVTQASTKHSSVDTNSGGGIVLSTMISGKEDGALLPVEKRYYVITGEGVYPATKKDIENKLPVEQQEAFKAFLKQNKIKWKDPKSLEKLLDFFE